MLTIRQAQTDAFARERTADFVQRVIAHLNQYFAASVKALGPEHAAALVLHAVDVAAQKGVVAERDVCKLANLMVAFGPDLFDTKPWASAAWNVAEDTALQRTNRLYAAALLQARQGQG